MFDTYNALRLLAGLILLSPIWSFTAIAAKSEPETHLIEYQGFRPSLYFTGNEGPEIAIFTAIKSEPKWRELWAQIGPRLSRDMRQGSPHPFPRIDFTRRRCSSRPSGLNLPAATLCLSNP
jgi:hypothetical protein